MASRLRVEVGSSLAIIALLLLAIALLGCFWHPALTGFRYHPQSDALWRGLVAQLIHLSPSHLAANLAGLLIAAVLAWRARVALVMLGVLLWTALVVALGLKLAPQPLAWYAGLSGALHGAFIWLALDQARRTGSRAKRWLAWGTAAMLSIKAAAGLAFPSTASFFAGDVPPAPSSHLLGVLGGLLAYCIGATWRDLRR